jgi:ribonuclease E
MAESSEARSIPIEVRDEAPGQARPQSDDIMSLPERAPAEPAEQPAAPEAEAPKPVIPEPEPVAVVLTPPDPDRPKRAGWWSKAKSVLSGS